MDKMLQIRIPAIGDLCLLAYAQHMEKTARSDAARRLFGKFVEQERRRLETRSSQSAPTASPFMTLQSDAGRQAPASAAMTTKRKRQT